MHSSTRSSPNPRGGRASAAGRGGGAGVAGPGVHRDGPVGVVEEVGAVLGEPAREALFGARAGVDGNVRLSPRGLEEAALSVRLGEEAAPQPEEAVVELADVGECGRRGGGRDGGAVLGPGPVDGASGQFGDRDVEGVLRRDLRLLKSHFPPGVLRSRLSLLRRRRLHHRRRRQRGGRGGGVVEGAEGPIHHLLEHALEWIRVPGFPRVVRRRGLSEDRVEQRSHSLPLLVAAAEGHRGENQGRQIAGGGSLVVVPPRAAMGLGIGAALLAYELPERLEAALAAGWLVVVRRRRDADAPPPEEEASGGGRRRRRRIGDEGRRRRRRRGGGGHHRGRDEDDLARDVGEDQRRQSQGEAVATGRGGGIGGGGGGHGASLIIRKCWCRVRDYFVFFVLSGTKKMNFFEKII